MKRYFGKEHGYEWRIPPNKKTVCKICDICDSAGLYYNGRVMGTDLDCDIHKGFTIGKGKRMYWMMIWHGSGHVTVFNNDDGPVRGRWIQGDTEITIHFW